MLTGPLQAAPRDEEDDLDDALADQLVRDFHFGGGHIPEQDNNEAEGGQRDGDAIPRRKNKREVMAELMAKSKAHKAARQLQHEEDDRAVATLNATLQELLEERRMASLFRPRGEKACVDHVDC